MAFRTENHRRNGVGPDYSSYGTRATIAARLFPARRYAPVTGGASSGRRKSFAAAPKEFRGIFPFIHSKYLVVVVVVVVVAINMTIITITRYLSWNRYQSHKIN